MKIIRECVKIKRSSYRIIIRTNTYAKHFDHFLMLFGLAKKDFPELEAEDTEIIHYGGRSYKGTYGIEFDVKKSPPKKYQKRSRPEFTL